MAEQTETIKRLEKILERINNSSGSERNFDLLLSTLEEEYHLAGGSYHSHNQPGSYLSHLKQTIDKQARVYQSTKQKRPVKGAPTEYQDFVSNFKQDVSNELSRLKYSSGSAAQQDEV